jgi:hypothetical protein
VASFFTPKGWHFSAQGNALGTVAPPNPSALKGHKNPEIIAPFQGLEQRPSFSQGVALG